MYSKVLENICNIRIIFFVNVKIILSNYYLGYRANKITAIIEQLLNMFSQTSSLSAIQ